MPRHRMLVLPVTFIYVAKVFIQRLTLESGYNPSMQLIVPIVAHSANSGSLVVLQLNLPITTF